MRQISERARGRARILDEHGPDRVYAPHTSTARSAWASTARTACRSATRRRSSTSAARSRARLPTSSARSS